MKVTKYNIEFDSELELKFYEYLSNLKADFVYNNKIKTPININLGRRKTYTPDFVVYDNNNKKIWIIETKGYDKWSGNECNAICDYMKNLCETNPTVLARFLADNKLFKEDYKIYYERVKWLKTAGFVPFSYKNPNTISNKRKQKILELENDVKTLKQELKNKDKLVKVLYKYYNNEKLKKNELELIRRGIIND